MRVVGFKPIGIRASDRIGMTLPIGYSDVPRPQWTCHNRQVWKALRVTGVRHGLSGSAAEGTDAAGSLGSVLAVLAFVTVNDSGC